MGENTLSKPGRGWTNVFFKTVGYITLCFGIIFSIWTGLKYFQYSPIQGLFNEDIQLGLSNLQIEIVSAGLMGLLATASVQRTRRLKRKKSSPLKMSQMIFRKEKNAHPLMRTPRPARDTNFVIRKTRNRGRISRNRMGERLPPTNINQPRVEESQ